jgi:hypothetical protein
LQAKKVDFEEREYGKNPFTEKELRDIIGADPIEPFLNTRTPLYREKNMKQKPPSKRDARLAEAHECAASSARDGEDESYRRSVRLHRSGAGADPVGLR